MGGPALINDKYYNEFDNFYICNFTEDGIEYKSTEHYYQSKKVLDPKIQKIIRDAKNAYGAFALGKMYPLRKGWEEMKVEIMFMANKLKFDQNPELKQKLIETYDFIEFPYSDNFWGSGDNNVLGNILMIIRSYYKGENRRIFELQKKLNFVVDWKN